MTYQSFVLLKTPVLKYIYMLMIQKHSQGYDKWRM